MEEAIEHCSRGASRWEFASNDSAGNGDPDVILACVGDVPTLETVAASWLLQKYVPEMKVRLVNVVDLTVLMSPDEHPHGMDDSFLRSALHRRPRRWFSPTTALAGRFTA